MQRQAGRKRKHLKRIMIYGTLLGIILAGSFVYNMAF
jgi:hypothetical protein